MDRPLRERLLLEDRLGRRVRRRPLHALEHQHGTLAAEEGGVRREIELEAPRLLVDPGVALLVEPAVRRADQPCALEIEVAESLTEGSGR